MLEEELNEIAEKLSDLIPLYRRKLMRPCKIKMKNNTSPLQLFVMLIMSEKEMSNLTELSDEVNMSKQQMTPIINKLQANGFVQREQDQLDRRSVNLWLTSVGVDFLKDSYNDMNRSMKLRIAGLDKNDLYTLKDALENLFRIIHKI